MGVKVQSIISNGSKGTIVDIECHLSNNLPTIVIVGSASKAVDESRERIRGAFSTSHIMLPRKRITVNLAPADIPKADSGFDMAIAVSILLAGGQVTCELNSTQAFIGELGLDGSTRAVRGIIGKLLFGRTKGITTFFIPAQNLNQAQLVPEINLIPVESLEQLCGNLCAGLPIAAIETGSGKYSGDTTKTSDSGVQLSDVVGQYQAKRALEIAAAGGHNVIFSGPPGTGKSMLAKALPSILPALTREEMLEVTHLHSLASRDFEQAISERPFRTPHHSASHVAVVGGGSNLRPGEISLAHRGVLFFDELPEFERGTLEALRQPLEDRVITLSRAKDSAEYPANFILVATANPCPCGYSGTETECSCPNATIQRYNNRISGPILDRIDLHCGVFKIDHEKLLSTAHDPHADEQVRLNITKARKMQSKRFRDPSKLNTDMTNSDIRRLAILDPPAYKFLNKMAGSMNISARSYMRTIKVARTIADLANSTNVTLDHITEALNYRTKTAKSARP